MNSRRSWAIFAFGTLAYLAAVLQRSSLGVTGVTATERFGISAAGLSSLAVIQLLVYALLQVPVGILLDRFGARALILAGASLMVAGQLLFSVAPSLPLAVIARLLVGAGDAMTFISVMRLLPNWFSGRSLPLVSQTLGTLGQVGQILSAVPLAFLLHAAGWTPTFMTAAGVSALAFFGVLFFVRDGVLPHTRTHPVAVIEGGRARIEGTSPLHRLREAISRPGTRLGFWSHFVTQSTGTVFTLLWGFPFLSVALGYGRSNSALLLTLAVLSALVAGPLLGLLSARFPLRRSSVVLGIVVAMGTCWAIVLLWPGTPPVWTVILLIVVIGIGGPGSLIGFDFARTFNPLRNLGSATGIVNVGGFLAAFVMMFVIGVVLDAWHAGHPGTGGLYTLEGFRAAFATQYLVVGTGVVCLIIARRQTRKRMHQEEGIVVAPLWVVVSRVLRQQRR